MRAVAPTTVRYLDPGWPMTGMLAVMNGHRPVVVEWGEGLDDPVRFAGDDPCIVFVANPGNPTGEAIPTTGSVPSRSAPRRLAAS